MKRLLLSASALAGSLIASQPVLAACTAEPDVVCALANADLVFNNIDSLVNNGDITSVGGTALDVWDFTTGNITNIGNIISFGGNALIIGDMSPGKRVTNNAGAQITTNAGVASAIVIAGLGNGIIDNFGLIKATTGDTVFGADGLTVNNGATGVIEAIGAGGTAVMMTVNGTVTNAAGGIIRAINAAKTLGGIAIDSGDDATITNAGEISGWDHAVILGTNSTLTNEAGGQILSYNDDVLVVPVAIVAGSGATINNSGVIDTPNFDFGVIDADLTTGVSTIINNAGGTIGHFGMQDGNGFSITFVNYVAGRGIVTNHGTIWGEINYDAGNDAFTNTGTMNGSTHMAGGDDTATLRGTVNGDVNLDAGDDTAIIDGPLTMRVIGITPIDFLNGGVGNDTLIFRGSTGSFYGEHVTTFEKLVKDGGGTSTLTGVWALANGADVQNGTLVLAAGSALGAATNVQAGGTLAGAGTVTGNLTNAGVVTGGAYSAVDTLTVTGNYTQTAAGRLDIELGTAGVNDKLAVGGTATLGGTVRFIPLDVAATGSYTFLTYATHTGQFATAEGGGVNGNLFSYTVAYNATNATVTLGAPTTPVPPAGGGASAPAVPALGLTPNQSAVSAALVTPGIFSADLAAVRAELNVMAPMAFAAALDTLSGETYAALPGAIAHIGGTLGHGLTTRLDGLRTGRAGGGNGGAVAFSASQRTPNQWAKAMASEAGHASTHDPEARSAVWIEGVGSWGEVDNRSGVAGFDYDTAGFVIGADRAVGDTARLGVMAGYASSDFDQTGRGAEADIDSYQFGVYGLADVGRVQLDGSAGYARHDIDVRRRLVTGATGTRTADGDSHADEWRADARAGIELAGGATSLRPSLGLGYVRVDQAGLTETGAGGAGLVVDGADYEALTATAMMDLSWTTEIGDAVLQPYLKAGIAHDLVQDGWSATARFEGGGAAFDIAGTEPGRTAGIAAIGVSAWLSDTLSLRAGYDLEVRKDMFVNAVSGSLTWRW